MAKAAFYFPPFHPNCRCTVVAVRDINAYANEFNPAAMQDSILASGVGIGIRADGLYDLLPNFETEDGKFHKKYDSFFDFIDDYADRLEVQFEFEDYDILNGSNFTDLANSIDRLAERYPLIFDKCVNAITMVDDADSYAMYFKKDGIIGMSRQYSLFSQIRDNYIRDMTTLYHPRADLYSFTIVDGMFSHEFGHAVDRFYTMETPKVDILNFGVSEFSSGKATIDDVNSMSGLMAAFKRELHKRYNNSLSRYAFVEGEDELFAEAFASYETGGSRYSTKAGRAVGRFFEFVEARQKTATSFKVPTTAADKAKLDSDYDKFYKEFIKSVFTE